MPRDGMSYKQALVKCPFYRSDNGQNRINCEGICGAHCVSLYFRRKNAFCGQIDRYCCDAYESCELHKLITGKYTG